MWQNGTILGMICEKQRTSMETIETNPNPFLQPKILNWILWWHMMHFTGGTVLQSQHWVP